MRIIINGIYGKMGRMILETAAGFDDLVVVCGFDKPKDVSISTHGPEPLGFKGSPVPVFGSPDGYDGTADVIIDFSHYSAVPGLLGYAASRGIPVVICTTALEDKARAAMAAASDRIAVFNSANMSLGVNVMKNLVSAAAPVFEDSFNVEIIEKHHNSKLDSPSGTALLLADAISDSCSEPRNYVYGRHGREDSIKLTDLGIHSVRGGTLPGEHTVIFAGSDEVLEITHRVFSRRVFAFGALKAAEFVVRKPAGLYSMDDLIAENGE